MTDRTAELRIAVTPPQYDDIGAVLKRLGYPFEDTQAVTDLRRLQGFDVVFLNCGTPAAMQPSVLEAYVRHGGTIYASDLTSSTIASAFPGAITFGAGGDTGKHPARVVDAGLRQFIGATIDLTFDMVGWSGISAVGAETDVYLEDMRSGHPLLVSFRHGKGRVIYTCFHNRAQASQKEQELLRFLVLKPILAAAEDEAASFAWAEKKQLQQVVGTVQPGGASQWFTYDVPGGATLTAVLNWRGQADLRLEIEGPGGSRQAEGTQPPVAVSIPAASKGAWRYRVVARQATLANFPFVAIVGTGANIAAPGGKRGPSSLVDVSGMDYNARWSSVRPGLLVVLLDQSTSMKYEFGGGQIGSGQRKADMVATVLNNVLNDFLRISSEGTSIRPRAELAVIGYGQSVASALPPPLNNKPLVTLPELFANPLRIEQRTRRQIDPDGRLYDDVTDFPVWVEPKSEGNTPMCEALHRVYELTHAWARAHPDSFPPVVINLTDGQATDGDPTDDAESLAQVTTRHGAALLFNCHITNRQETPIEFVADPAKLPADPWARGLFFLSSLVPASAASAFLASTDRDLVPGTRAYIFNGDAGSVRRMMVFGSTAAQG